MAQNVQRAAPTLKCPINSNGSPGTPKDDSNTSNGDHRTRSSMPFHGANHSRSPRISQRPRSSMPFHEANHIPQRHEAMRLHGGHHLADPRGKVKKRVCPKKRVVISCLGSDATIPKATPTFQTTTTTRPYGRCTKSARRIGVRVSKPLVVRRL